MGKLNKGLKMKKENTCGACKNLKHGDLGGLKTAYCGITDFVVPHMSNLEHGKRGDDTIMVLTRIPISCERTDTHKSESPAPEKDWIRIVVPST